MNSKQKLFVVIMAGGSGTRFWPVSRQARPKQFLALGKTAESLIQATARRVQPLLSNGENGALLVVTNNELATQVRQHVPNAEIISEPYGRSTAASIGLAALTISSANPEGVMIVLPADHSISDEDALREVLTRAVEVARTQDALVTLGIKPESPNTAYGYIQRGEATTAEGAYRVARFFEKPNVERAEEYCAAGNFYWNSGMFVWKASTILRALEQHMPKLYSALQRIEEARGKREESLVLEAEFKALESVSIDFGVLEHARNCVVVEAESFGWNDVGSWDAWSQHFPPDKRGNILAGDVLQVQADNCIAYAASKKGSAGYRLIALLGVEDIVVVDTEDALLICNRDKVQDVRQVVDELRKRGRVDLL